SHLQVCVAPLSSCLSRRRSRQYGHQQGPLPCLLPQGLQSRLSEITRTALNPANPFADAEYDKHPSGYIIVDGVEVARTKQCCHCGQHFISKKGSGVIRGRCAACGGKITCGAPKCDVHIPFEAKLDILDGGNVSEAAQF